MFSNSNCIWKTISFICRNYLGCMGFIWNQELFGNVWNSLVGWSSSTRPIYSKVFMLSSEVAFWLGTLAAMDPTKRCKLNTVLHRMKILGAPKATFFENNVVPYNIIHAINQQWFLWHSFPGWGADGMHCPVGSEQWSINFYRGQPTSLGPLLIKCWQIS